MEFQKISQPGERYVMFLSSRSIRERRVCKNSVRETALSRARLVRRVSGSILSCVAVVVIVVSPDKRERKAGREARSSAPFQTVAPKTHLDIYRLFILREPNPCLFSWRGRRILVATDSLPSPDRSADPFKKYVQPSPAST